MRLLSYLQVGIYIQKIDTHSKDECSTLEAINRFSASEAPVQYQDLSKRGYPNTKND